MNLNEIRSEARNHMKTFCNVCPQCNGVYCQGKVPGMGGVGSGSSMKRNFDALAKISLNMRTIHNATNPQIQSQFLGQDLSIPLMTAPVTGSVYNMGGALSEEEYYDAIIQGTKEAGSITFIGDGGNPDFLQSGLKKLISHNAPGVVIIKPRENHEIIKRIRMAEESGALGVGIDLDGAGLVTMALMGQPVDPKTPEDLKEIISSTNLPVILKGILSPEEARIAVEVGASAIVVSNHGGRILEDTLSSAEVLGDIVKAVRGKITIIADGSVRDGKDIFKYLALGADLVLAARPFIWGAYGNGPQGVNEYYQHFKTTLITTMKLTGAESLSAIDSKMITHSL